MDTFSLNRKERVQRGELTKQAIGHLMEGIAASPVTLMEVVAGGRLHFRHIFLKEMRGYIVDGNVSDLVFKFFCEQVVRRFGPQTDPQVEAARFLDTHAPKSKPTEQEIEDSWVHEVYSSDEGRMRFYNDGPGIAGDSKVIVH